MEDYFEAELACGRHLSVLSAVESMVEAEPLRERACGQLMRALYYCGRQADALGVYSRVRTALVEGLGLEPGRELRLLQEAILTHDPALHVPAPLPGVPPRAAATSVPASASAPADTPGSPVPARREPARGDQGRRPNAATSASCWYADGWATSSAPCPPSASTTSSKASRP